MKPEPVEIPFPIGGLDKRRSFQTESPQTTVGSVNVVPDSQEEGRTRGGVRSGLAKTFPEQLPKTPLFLAIIDSPTYETDQPVRYLVVGNETHVYRSRSIKTEIIETATSYSQYLELITGDLGTGSGTVLSSNVSVTTRAGFMLIADIGPKIIDGVNGTVSGGVLTISEDTAEVDIEDHVLFVETSGCPAIETGAYQITSKTTNTLTLAAGSDVVVGTGAVSVYSVRKGAKYIDLEEGTSGLFLATRGIAPLGATVVAMYRDRAF